MALPVPSWPGPDPSQYGRPGRPSPYAWSAAAPFICVPGVAMILGALAVTWGPAVGDGTWILCLNTPVPDGFAPEAYVRTEPTFWPLGYNCVFGAGTGTSVTIYEDNWVPTIVAIVGTAIVIAGIVATIAAYTRWLHR